MIRTFSNQASKKLDDQLCHASCSQLEMFGVVRQRMCWYTWQKIHYQNEYEYKAEISLNTSLITIRTCIPLCIHCSKSGTVTIHKLVTTTTLFCNLCNIHNIGHNCYLRQSNPVITYFTPYVYPCFKLVRSQYPIIVLSHIRNTIHHYWHTFMIPVNEFQQVSSQYIVKNDCHMYYNY